MKWHFGAIAVGAAIGLGMGWLMVHSESSRYAASAQEAPRFAARMGVVHRGCANQSCSGLLSGKPVTYFCTPHGCAFDTEKP